jgi:hypothetical protein
MILLTLLVKYPFLEEYIKTLYPIPNDWKDNKRN